MAEDEILVIGAGIIGLTTAQELIHSGHKVRIVDAGFVGSGTSYGHTAMLSIYSAYALDPAQLQVPVEQGGFKHPDAKFATLPHPEWARKYSNHEKKDQLRARANLARAGINNMIAEPDWALQRAGFYFGHGKRFYFDPERAKQDAKSFAKLGIAAQLEETSFRSAKSSVSFPAGCMNIYEYCCALASVLERDGVEITQNTRVNQLLIKNGMVTGALIDGKQEHFKSVVICTGADKVLLHNANENVATALAPFTGVSINARISEERAAKLPKVFQVSYQENGNHHIITITNIYNDAHPELRLAGFFAAGVLEKGAKFDFAINELQRFLKKIAPDHQDVTVWHGVRPMTNDGLPIIGPDPRLKGLYYNIGHGSSAVPLCKGSAMIATEYLNDERLAHPRKMFDIDLALLSPARYRQRTP